MTAQRIRPAVETRSLTWFNLMPEGAPKCRECGAQLNVEPFGSDELDGFHVEDVVNVGLRKKVGSAYECRRCAFDEGVQAARLRRVERINHRGNYIA